MKKILIIFFSLFLFACGNTESKIEEKPQVETESIVENSEKNSNIEKRLSNKEISIVISSYSGPEEWRNELPSVERGYIRDMFFATNTKEFYENRNNFPAKNATIYSLHLDDYRYDIKEMYTKEQMILVFEILSLYKNLSKNIEITLGNTDYLADKEFLSALKNLPVENLVVNDRIMFQN